MGNEDGWQEQGEDALAQQIYSSTKAYRYDEKLDMHEPRAYHDSN